MRALQLFDRNVLRLMDVPTPEPPLGEVLIRTLATTICTSDIDDIAYSVFSDRFPRTLGHEACGVVEAVGKGVVDLKPGDRVAVHPVVSCGTCANCRRGLGHLCLNMSHLGIDRDGTFAEFFCIPPDRCRSVPDGVSSTSASLLEPVTVCIQALRRGRITEGDSVLIVGDGPFGLLISRLAADYRPSELTVVGRHEFRLARVTGGSAMTEAQLEEALDGGHNPPFEVDLAVQAAGSAGAVDLCIRAVRARGRIVVFSNVVKPAPINLARVHMKELEIYGSCNDEGYLDEAIRALSDPALGLAELVTHEVPFADWEHAIDLASNGKDAALKVALTFG
jgi:threonine dehydrogenase-like Zn-dependent dehydrogenase